MVSDTIQANRSMRSMRSVVLGAAAMLALSGCMQEPVDIHVSDEDPEVRSQASHHLDRDDYPHTPEALERKLELYANDPDTESIQELRERMPLDPGPE